MSNKIVRHIHRFAETQDGTLGRMGRWCILEEENQGNKPNISAIPTGQYLCKRVWSPRFQMETFQVMDVPGRTHILFHPLNTEEDTEGCIGHGTNFAAMMRKDEDTGHYVPKLAIVESKKAFKEFMHELADVDEFTLIITGP